LTASRFPIRRCGES